jgi:transmembrane sensor
MNDNATYYTDLITRYFAGEIGEDELRELSDWLAASPENEKFFKQYHKTWLLIEKQKVNSAIDIDKDWNAFQSKLNALPETGKAPKVISLNTNQPKIRTTFFTLQRVAAAVIILVSTFLLYFYFSKPSEIVVTAQADNIEQLLPDGSVVSLHAGSQLTYPEKFTSKTRNVKLKGEAYFKVMHDGSKPFIVATGDARVEVLGTEFNVNTSSAEGNMEVVLTSGKVSVYYTEKPAENVLLLPGEKAELIADQKFIRKETNTDPNYMAWKTRVLVFDNESLAQVVKTLRSVYQTSVILKDDQLAGCRVTASFNDQSLESVLEVLKQTLELQVQKDGENITLSGNGCK